jgi:lipopolysaccharide biosynthesis glycosyltransferase
VNLFDQEALNVAVGADWRRLSYRWNLIASVAGRSFLDTALLRREDYAESLQSPHIVHFAGTLKPWLNPFLRGRWFDLYRAALSRALPAHKFHSTLRHLVHATYDASVRRWVYPLERTAWQTLRGF